MQTSKEVIAKVGLLPFHERLAIADKYEHMVRWELDVDDDDPYAKALYNLFGWDHEPNLTKVHDIFKTLSARDDPLGHYCYGYVLNTGCGVAKDDDAARVLFEKAAEAGIAPAKNSVAMMHMNGIAGPIDDDRALAILTEIENTSYPPAIFNLGVLYYHGRSVEKNGVRAVQYFQRASDLGFLLATRILAKLYRDGDCVEKDEVRADALLEQAALLGSIVACREVGIRFIHDGKHESALDYLIVAADGGDHKATELIDRIYKARF